MHAFPHTHNTNSTSGLLATRGDEETSLNTKAKDLRGHNVRKKKGRVAKEKFKDEVMKRRQQVFVCVIGDHTSRPHSFSSPYFLLKLCMHLALLFCPCMGLVHINYLPFVKSRCCSSANPCSWSTTAQLGKVGKMCSLIPDHTFVKLGQHPLIILELHRWV